MPKSSHVLEALSLIENDKAKILGLTVGKHANVQPGDYIPRAGKPKEGARPELVVEDSQ